MKKFKFDRREDYKRMKQKDRSQLENAINAECEKAYQKGYEAGRKATVFQSERGWKKEERRDNGMFNKHVRRTHERSERK